MSLCHCLLNKEVAVSMAEYRSMLGSGREEKISMVMQPGQEVMGEEGFNLASVGKSLASEDYYRQQGRVWKFRSENLDEEEFEVAAAGSGWREENDCDNFQRFFNLLQLTQTNKQYV